MINEEFFNEERNLSSSETTIMKAIWDTGEDISIPDLIELLRTNYNKDYARTTVVTFLIKLSDKGFVRTYRKGKLSYAHAMKSEDYYKTKIINEELEYWFSGDVANLCSALHKGGNLTEDDRANLKSFIDQLDD